jgi:predicted ATP-dependent endonuclease of OLD family
VDEAEMHLHYDAQSDLIRVFEEQDETAQVVYTTHSIGALPQDLGRGVRVVTPAPDSTISTIENVWCREGAGVAPLMLAMGAATVPLSPSRYVVIAEGASDAVLLPSILRDALGLSRLEYQVVSGLAEASEAELRRLDRDAPRVIYLVDGDSGGSALSKRLRSYGIRAKKIVSLSPAMSGLVLEDLLDAALYVEAINAYLGQWPPHARGFTEPDLSKVGRPNSVKVWTKAAGLANPSKLRIAEEVLRILDDPDPRRLRRVANADRKKQVTALDKRIRFALGIDASATA